MEEGLGAHKPLGFGIDRVLTTKPLVKSCNSSDGGYEPDKLMMLLKLFLACSVCGGIHYGWALQISLLTPYAQILGVPHMFASFICSSGPMAGVLVNPILSYYSNRCTMTMGRRRPFILAGCLLICISVMLIGFSVDIGQLLGDPKEQCGVYNGPRKGASTILILSFWLFDVANNIIQGPTRALMADLCVYNNHDHHIGEKIYSLWAGIGVFIGYVAGATDIWTQWFPWLKTEACCGICITIKGAFITTVVLIVLTMTLTMTFSDEQPIGKKDVDTASSHAFSNPFKCLKYMPPSTTKLFIVTGASWLALFPFFIYCTDWMGREIYHGNPQGAPAEVQMYNNGVRKGCTALIFCHICHMVTTFLMPKLCDKLTKKVVWCLSNLLLFLLMSASAIISVISTKGYGLTEPDRTLMVLTVIIFTLMGITTAITLSLPPLVASQLVSQEGFDIHIHTIGAITIAMVVPQLIMVLTTGPIDKAFANGGNAPGYGLSAILAFVAWVLGLFLLS